MQESITKTDQGHIVTIEKSLLHSIEDVWAYLTENAKIKLWFSELAIQELKIGGLITFDMGDGSFEEMKIVELEPLKMFSFTWDRDTVRFELHPTADGCRLIFTEMLTALTDHTPRDLAGWHVCLDVIAALLDGKELPARKAAWEVLYEQYREAINRPT